MSCTRAVRFVAFAAENGAAGLRLKRDRVVLTAIVANDLKPSADIRPLGGLFRAAFWAPLRLHHVPLIKNVLIFFRENEYLSALNARDLNIRHSVTSDPYD